MLGSLKDVAMRTLAVRVRVGLRLTVSVDRKKAKPRGCENPKDTGREERRLGDSFVGGSGRTCTNAPLAKLRPIVGFHEGCHRRIRSRSRT